jgi:hypothetical protein
MAARTFLAARAPLFGHGQPFTVVLISKLLHRPHLWSPPPIVNFFRLHRLSPALPCMTTRQAHD